ncbi:MAG: TIGR03620 family F420-dependent LLM class oxidoreductase [Novosphingobium sp.]|nr:TIGR03620 family F420-dependent LLM class oxidoreductase [Novosphingobium sp.]
MNIGRLGIFLLADVHPAPDLVALTKRAEDWGYGTVWIPEAFARNPMVGAALILANTDKLNVATGIANIYARDSLATVNAQYGLAEMSNGRFLLGLGVSHRALVEGMRGQQYQDKPLALMRSYLERMRATEYQGPPPPEKPATVLGALGPKMLALSASHADGAHPYNVTPDHTKSAREILGPGKLLCPEQKVLLETDASKARAIAREALALYLTLPNYRNNFTRMGFSDEDMDNGGSDRLVDAMVAWGDEGAIRKRLQEHFDAGADHVAVNVLAQKDRTITREDEKILELLAPGNEG